MFKKQLLIALLISLLIISGCAYEIDSIEVPEASSLLRSLGLL
jgi:PBP1b-binding outer membrane lipoprotein LpoB